MKKSPVFIFWQNSLSMLQSAFLRSLAESHRVVLVAEAALNSERLQQKWAVPDFGKVEVVVGPGDEAMHALLDMPGAIHIFSGINAFALPYRAFKIATRRKLPVGVMSEPFNYLGVKGKLRVAMYRWLRVRFARRIAMILVTGDLGRRSFAMAGFPRRKLFDWGYFTESVDCPETEADQRFRIIFVGSLDGRKNIVSLVEAFCELNDSAARLTIIGGGPLEDEVKELARGRDDIELLGNRPNGETLAEIAASDLLVLPSVWDGWGAVVSEALMQGTPAVASDRCGSSVLLDGAVRGEVFGFGTDDLRGVLSRRIAGGKVSPQRRAEIKNWARENISGQAAARYFLEVADAAFGGGDRKNRPAAPWLLNK